MFFNQTRVEKINLAIPKFKEIVGLKLLHLSDLHIFKFGARERKIISLVNQENPDLILITGDLIVHFKNEYSGCIDTLKKLKAQYGIFAVFGNADQTLYPISVRKHFEAALKQIHVTLLKNQNEEIKHNGTSFYLVGVDDPFYLFDNFEVAIHEVPVKAPTILLAHSPDILFPRTDALAINLLESPFKKDHFKEWGWEDSTHFSPDGGDVYFQNSGAHTLRVQSRQNGVSLDIILLNPYPEINDMLGSKYFNQFNRLLITKDIGTEYPDLIIIPARKIKRERIYGKWKKIMDPSAISCFRLVDLPPQKKWRYQPLINPKDYFEADFVAQKSVKYHVWVRMKAHKGSPKKDSIYVQFNDSIDKYGQERYRLGKPAHVKDRMRDVDLILSGHTHGGQVRIPFYGPLATMTEIGKKYASGLHRFGESILYVSRGFGTSVLPIRFLCPPEITVFNII